jgi:pimeloyl-ACP methyl ester carboxylesterase
MAYAKRGSVELYYQMVGEGEAITFAHGAGGNAASWYQQVPHFSKFHKTLTFDHRAFARSACDPEEYQVSEFADDLAAILDAAGIEKTALVCQSMGGWTGINFSLKYPDRVSCLVMSHTTGGISNDKIKEEMARVAASRQPASEPFGSWAIAADLPEKDPEKANLYKQIGNFNVIVNLEKILSGLGGVRASITQDDLKDFSIATLFITSSMDVLIPSAAVYEAAEMIAGARVHFFDGIGHSSYFECADEFNKVVAEFLSESMA